MKKFGIIFISLLIIMVTAIGCLSAKEQTLDTSEYFRIHIRANSNNIEDQRIKYLIKEKIVSLLTPVLANSESKQVAMQQVKKSIPLIEKTASAILSENGFFYGAKASVKREDFPVRIYDEVTLPSGEYDCLIVELGSAKGDNWWCVIYPPLCFTGGDIRYRSKIKEIIERFFT